MKKQDPGFWLTNISNMNVSLMDLNLTIKPFSSVNLLDKRHYQYTKEQLEKSVLNGSVFKKRDKVVARSVAPQIIKKTKLFDSETPIPTRERSILNIKEEKYEELNISDEDFAKENADSAELDQKPLLLKV